MEDIIIAILGLFGTVIMGFFTKALASAVGLLSSKVRNETLRGIVERLDDLVLKVVNEVYQTYVREIKNAREDGTLTEEEKAEAKRIAIAKLKEYLGPKGLTELHWLVTGNADDFLSTLIENTVVQTSPWRDVRQTSDKPAKE